MHFMSHCTPERHEVEILQAVDLVGPMDNDTALVAGQDDLVANLRRSLAHDVERVEQVRIDFYGRRESELSGRNLCLTEQGYKSTMRFEYEVKGFNKLRAYSSLASLDFREVRQ
jgi:hypothetical protein